jgi:hypothetical protein
MRKPIDSPANWRAADIDPDGALKRRLTEPERDDLLRLFDAVRLTRSQIAKPSPSSNAFP